MISRTLAFSILFSVTITSCTKDDNALQPVATTGAIKGKVSLSSGAAALAANIYTLPPGSSTTTDTGGVYMLPALSPGTYTVVAVKNDTTGSRQVVVRPGETTQCDILLSAVNQLPGMPENISPLDGSSIYSTVAVLQWSCRDPDGDVLSYDVYLDTNNPPGTLVESGVRDSTFTTVGLDTGRTYYWRIIAKDNHGGGTSGEVWRFATRSAPSDSDLVMFLPFDGDANDRSRYGNNATVHGAALTSDRFGTARAAYSFNGVSDHLEIADNASLRLTSRFTLCGWVYPTGFYSGRCQANMIISKGYTMDEAGYYSVGYVDDLVWEDCSLFIPTDERYGSTTNFTGLARWKTGDTMRISTGRWYFVAETYDGAAIRLYVNGTFRGSVAVAGVLATNTRSIWIGACENPDYPYPVKGKIDDIRIYRRALSGTEIQALYTQQVFR